MDSLLHIADDLTAAEAMAPNAGEVTLPQEVICSAAGVQALEWVVQSLGQDADEVCRDLKTALIKLCGQFMQTDD